MATPASEVQVQNLDELPILPKSSGDLPLAFIRCNESFKRIEKNLEKLKPTLAMRNKCETAENDGPYSSEDSDSDIEALSGRSSPDVLSYNKLNDQQRVFKEQVKQGMREDVLRERLKMEEARTLALQQENLAQKQLIAEFERRLKEQEQSIALERKLRIEAETAVAQEKNKNAALQLELVDTEKDYQGAAKQYYDKSQELNSLKSQNTNWPDHPHSGVYFYMKNLLKKLGDMSVPANLPRIRKQTYTIK